MLELKQKTYYKITHSQIESLVRDKYDKEYEYAYQNECSNDTFHAGYYHGEDEDDLRVFDEFVKNDGVAYGYNIMAGLIRDGHLPPGDYLIDISW